METLSKSLGFIAIDESSQKLLSLLKKYAIFSEPVLLQGETGVGKEVAANALHQMSNRAEQPFVAVNCAAWSDSIAESELFGHEKGSFTGASQTHIGAFEQAHNGTLFLDEMGELSLPIQAKLLRVLENSEIRRVGGEQTRKVNVRIICATHRDLAKDTERCRPDIYYRISTLKAMILPLRQRPGDLMMLCEAFLRKKAPETGPRTLSANAMKKLLEYHWPGNVRELRNVITRAAINSDDVVIGPESIELEPASVCPTAQAPRGLRSVSQEVFTEELNRNKWNRNETARTLGIARSTVKEKIKKYGLKDPNQS
jgi:DNA-binding NtrC family response regulator